MHSGEETKIAQELQFGRKNQKFLNNVNCFLPLAVSFKERGAKIFDAIDLFSSQN